MTDQLRLNMTASVLLPWMDGRTRGATFDKVGRYRYILWRNWDDKPFLCVVMLNPSMADEGDDDNTIRAVTRHAKAKGYGGIIVVNLYAYIATHPQDLKLAKDPIGAENDAFIVKAVAGSNAIWCAWGAHAGRSRVREVVGVLMNRGVPLYHVGLTKDGMPRHPLYVATKDSFIPWNPT